MFKGRFILLVISISSLGFFSKQVLAQSNLHQPNGNPSIGRSVNGGPNSRYYYTSIIFPDKKNSTLESPAQSPKNSEYSIFNRLSSILVASTTELICPEGEDKQNGVCKRPLSSKAPRPAIRTKTTTTTRTTTTTITPHTDKDILTFSP